MRKYIYFSLIVLGMVLSACGTDTSSATTMVKSTHTATTAPTQKPAANAIAATSGATLLGSPLSAFVGRYGQPNDHTNAKNGDYHFARYPDSNTDSIIVQTDTFDGGAYSQKVMSILAAAPGTGWSPSQGNTACSGFYPMDATYKSKMQLTSGMGYDKIYSSTALVQTFPADAFDDNNNVQTTAGLFDAQYLINADGSVDSCNIEIGTQQAQ